MTLEIQQDYRYRGDDYWDWSIWLDGSEEELDRVDRVIYVLHRTFPKPVREVSDRSTRFLLKTAGWGVFEIRAKVLYKDGQETLLRHYLELRYPDGTPTEA